MPGSAFLHFSKAHPATVGLNVAGQVFQPGRRVCRFNNHCHAREDNRHKAAVSTTFFVIGQTRASIDLLRFPIDKAAVCDNLPLLAGIPQARIRPDAGNTAES